jgi:UDP-N-acetylglucosamine 1-carboxyvinyltransferase
MISASNQKKYSRSSPSSPIVRIFGGKRLVGSVTVGGSKNACLPVLAASILTDEECIINNVPALSDTATMVEIIRGIGVEVSYIGIHSLRIRAREIFRDVKEAFVRKMRGSVCLMGALIGRSGKATIPIPGGCVIGPRPIDLHVKGFRLLGCNVIEKDGFLSIDGEGIHGAKMFLSGERGSTVTGTINVIMAALRANDKTIIEGAAIEPEVTDFCRYLAKMGAKISGIGTANLEITGGTPLHGCEYTIMGDRIEAGTFVCAGLITGGNIKIFGIEHGFLNAFLEKLRSVGADVSQDASGMIHVRSVQSISATEIVTGPYPGFPTDLQAQLCSLLTQSDGKSTITDVIYPDRFMYVPELKKMGANIDVVSPSARINGNADLSGAHLTATDLRASAALYLAGLRASGKTVIHDVFHLDRGYENFEGKLAELGADIERI